MYLDLGDLLDIDDYHWYLLNEVKRGRLVARRLDLGFIGFYNPEDLNDEQLSKCLTYNQIENLLKEIRARTKFMSN